MAQRLLGLAQRLLGLAFRGDVAADGLKEIVGGHRAPLDAPAGAIARPHGELDQSRCRAPRQGVQLGLQGRALLGNDEIHDVGADQFGFLPAQQAASRPD